MKSDSEKSYQIRNAVYEDWELLLAWRNDPLTRAHSTTHGELDAASHQAWLRQKLSDPDCGVFLFLLDRTPIGVLRLERCGDTATIHYTIAPEARGKGCGTRVIALAETLVPAGVTALEAEVLPDNPASLRCFEKNGYHRLPPEEGSRLIRFQRTLS